MALRQLLFADSDIMLKRKNESAARLEDLGVRMGNRYHLLFHFSCYIALMRDVKFVRTNYGSFVFYSFCLASFEFRDLVFFSFRTVTSKPQFDTPITEFDYDCVPLVKIYC